MRIAWWDTPERAGQIPWAAAGFFSSKLRLFELINTSNIFSAEKHGVPERKTLEKRKRARYIITNGTRPRAGSASKRCFLTFTTQ